MNAVLIAYDLHKIGQRYHVLRKIVTDNFSIRWDALESMFIVATMLTPVQVRDLLASALDSNDELLVVCLKESAWSSIGFSKEDRDWLRKNT